MFVHHEQHVNTVDNIIRHRSHTVCLSSRLVYLWLSSPWTYIRVSQTVCKLFVITSEKWQRKSNSNGITVIGYYECANTPFNILVHCMMPNGMFVSHRVIHSASRSVVIFFSRYSWINGHRLVANSFAIVGNHLNDVFAISPFFWFVRSTCLKIELA